MAVCNLPLLKIANNSIFFLHSYFETIQIVSYVGYETHYDLINNRKPIKMASRQTQYKTTENNRKWCESTPVQMEMKKTKKQ